MRIRSPLWSTFFAMLLVASGLCGGLPAGEITLAQLKAESGPDRDFVFKRVGETELQLHLYLPGDHDPGDRRAGMIMLHGGGWAAEGIDHVAPLCRYFALRGMVVANAAYRLADRETGVTIRACVADARDAFRTVHQQSDQLGIDPERIVVAGESAGGHLAAAVGFIPADDGVPNATTLRPAALILYNPCLDLEALAWTKKHPALAPPATATETEGWRARARRWSPIHYVSAGAPPTLLLHGKEDGVVPAAQIEAFAGAMKANGNVITLHLFEDWGHAFALPVAGTDQQVAETLRRTDRFLAGLGYLDGEPPIARSNEAAGQGET